MASLDRQLEWPQRFVGGGLSLSGDHTARAPEGVRAGVVSQYDDGTLAVHSSGDALPGFRHRLTDETWTAVWGTPVPEPGADPLDVLASVPTQGTARLESLAGSWVAIVYSTRTHELRLITDCIASRPCFWHHDSARKRVCFATDAHQLRAIAGMAPDLNPDVLASWLWFGFNIAQTGVYSGAHHLMPASVLHIDRDGHATTTAYLTPTDVPSFSSRDDLIECFEHEVGRACRYACDQSSGVNLLLSGGWDSRYVLAHLVRHAGNGPVVATTVDHYGEAGPARAVADAAGIPLDVLSGSVNPEDSFDHPFHCTLEGLAFTKHATYLAARHRAGVPAIQGYLGDSLVRAKNARGLTIDETADVRQQAVAIVDHQRAMPRGILAVRAYDAVRARCVELVVNLLSSSYAGRPMHTFDVYGRQRRYIANNFLQHIETNDVVVPFCSWPLIANYVHGSGTHLNEAMYPEMFRRLNPALGELPRHAGAATRARRSRWATSWAIASARAIASRKHGPLLNRTWLAPRAALGAVRPDWFYVVRNVASVATQAHILERLTGSASIGDLVREGTA